MKKRALISVYDKTGVLDLAKSLEELDWEIISTGGTFKYLQENGVSPINIEEVTNFREILEGRVKTLNPYIHGGILFKRDKEEHIKTIEKLEISSIDMVVNNLYPFEDKLKENSPHDEMIENIDIGGPTMIRSSAKNYKDVIILIDPLDYGEIVEKLKDGDLEENIRMNLARKAFSYTAHYDSLISNYFNRKMDIEYPEMMTIPFKLGQKLRYGENPHQSGAFYKNSFNDLKINFNQIHGKELSYNNFNDIYETIKAIKDFEEPTVVGVKHTNPSGIGSGETIYEAYMKAYNCDSESIFGGIIALNREVDEKCAEHMSSYFLEIIIAPSFSEEALNILTKKKNLRLIEIKELNDFKLEKMSYKQVLGGMIYQERDEFSEEERDIQFELMTDRKPTDSELEDIKFGWRCVKSIASNGVALVKDKATIGIGQGEVRRSWAVEEAINRSFTNQEGVVLISDAFFFEDTVELAKEVGIKVLVSPGGSIKDEEVIKLCKKYDMTLLFTGLRHFRH